MIECRTCGREFDPDTKRRQLKAGYWDQCLRCSLNSRDNSKKYLGRPGATSKGANIEIFRADLATARAYINRERSAGPHPSLPFKTTGEMKFSGEMDEDGEVVGKKP